MNTLRSLTVWMIGSGRWWPSQFLKAVLNVQELFGFLLLAGNDGDGFHNAFRLSLIHREKYWFWIVILITFFIRRNWISVGDKIETFVWGRVLFWRLHSPDCFGNSCVLDNYRQHYANSITHIDCIRVVLADQPGAWLLIVWDLFASSLP